MFNFGFKKKWRLEFRKRDKSQVEVRFITATSRELFDRATEECEELGNEWIIWDIRSPSMTIF